MKKVILLFLFCIIPIKVNASICVMDMDSKRLLYGSSETQEKLIASTTKIMTSLVVIQNVDNLDEEIEITEAVLKSTGSGIYVEVGEHISVLDLLYGLMLRSGNDAAIMLAEYVGGSMEGFTLLMNEYAANIGMKNTKFINSSGLEDNLGNGNTSTCYDMALLMSEASKNEILMNIMGTKHHTVQTDYKYYDWYNKNKLLSEYKYTTGGKTGYTKKAYRTLVTSATKDNKNLTVVTLDERDDFEKHKNKYTEYFKKYKLVNVVNKKTFLKKEGYEVKNDINMLLLNSEIKKVKVDVYYTSDARNRAGYVTVSLNGVEYFKENIYKREKKVNTLSKVKDILTKLFN
ncbi:MAG: D-alanyl-D-alanine carboxypeptidase [Erysipelotrichales bacterium]|nr:D-alanyl-D-alanine carboxypeptidase [Erysipelotrichales bacterium]